MPNGIPKLPKGFVLQQPQQLPPGFVLQQQPFQFGGGRAGIGGAGGIIPTPSPLEQRIARRPDILQQAGMGARGVFEQFRKTPFRSAVGLEPQARFGMPLLQAAGGLFQRGQAGVAAPLMELQRGVIAPQRLGMAAWRGLTGERLAELGDIPRQIGWPEPISATIGLFSTMGLTNLATQGKLVSSAKKATKFVSSKLPKVMNKNYLINRAKLASSGLDDLYEGMSQQYDDMYNAIGNKTVNLSRMQEIADDLPQIITSKVNKSNLIQKMPDGSVAPTLNNLKIIKNIIRKAVPKNVLSGRQQADVFQGNMKYNLERVKDLMAEGNPELQTLNNSYREFMQMRNTVGRVIWDVEGKPTSEGLAGLYKRAQVTSKQEAFTKFAQLWPQAQQIIKDSMKYSQREAAKAGFKRFAPWIPAIAGGGYMGTRLLRGGGEGGGFE